MAVFKDLWPCFITTKLSYAQLFKWGHSIVQPLYEKRLIYFTDILHCTFQKLYPKLAGKFLFIKYWQKIFRKFNFLVIGKLFKLSSTFNLISPQSNLSNQKVLNAREITSDPWKFEPHIICLCDFMNILDNIIVWAPSILYLKGLGMRNLQHEMRICQKSHNKVKKTVYLWF